MDKKNIKEKSKKVEKKKVKVKKESFFVGVRKELSLVAWPSKKNVSKYTISTVIFILFVTGFFILLNLLLSVVKGWLI